MKKRYQPIVTALIAIIVSIIVPVGCKQKDAPPAAEALTSPIWSGGVDVDWYDSSKSEFTLTTAEQFEKECTKDTELPMLNIKAYLNDREISGPIYKNLYEPSYLRSHSDAFVKLTTVFNLLGSIGR